MHSRPERVHGPQAGISREHFRFCFLQTMQADGERVAMERNGMLKESILGETGSCEERSSRVVMVEWIGDGQREVRIWARASEVR
jgi:hypothetical protein